jgi:hypothetical protein
MNPTKVPEEDPHFTKDDFCYFTSCYCKSAKNCPDNTKKTEDKKE